MLENNALKDFYNTSAGHGLCKKIRRFISNFWPVVISEKIIGYGFAQPYLPLFSQANSVVAIMPTSIGAINTGQNLPCVVAEADMLPIRHEYADKVLCIHGAEGCNILAGLFHEFWRILKPYGKILVVYDAKLISQKQIIDTLKANKFRVTHNKKAGFFESYYIAQAQKLVFATRGKAPSKSVSILEKLFKPRLIPNA